MRILLLICFVLGIVKCATINEVQGDLLELELRYNQSSEKNDVDHVSFTSAINSLRTRVTAVERAQTLGQSGMSLGERDVWFNETRDSFIAMLQAETARIDAAAATSLLAQFASADSAWLLLGTLLVFVMYGGLTMLESAAVESAHIPALWTRRFLVVSVVSLVWWAVGFGFAFGGDDSPDNGFIGTGSYFLISDGYFPGTKGYSFPHFTFHLACCILTCGIMLGGIASRASLPGTLLVCLALGGWVYPVVVHWVWSKNGWLSAGYPTKYTLGKNGLLDLAGGGVVHLVGGCAALVGAWMVSPRRVPGTSTRRFDYLHPHHSYALFAPQNLALHTGGVVLLYLGWLGFHSTAGFAVANSRSTDVFGRACANSILAGSTAALTAIIIGWYQTNRAEPHHLSWYFRGVERGVTAARACFWCLYRFWRWPHMTAPSFCTAFLQAWSRYLPRAG